MRLIDGAWDVWCGGVCRSSTEQDVVLYDWTACTTARFSLLPFHACGAYACDACR